MAHDPRIFVGPQQCADGSGHQLHLFSANSNGLTAILAQPAATGGLRELTTAEYSTWDAGNHTFKDVEAHGR